MLHINGGIRTLGMMRQKSLPPVRVSSHCRVTSFVDRISDIIRPDWEAKLAAVQAAVARRANRRIIMRQVGDRLIPVGVTSGRVHAINPEDAQAEGEGGSGSSRRRRRQQQQQQAGQTLDQFLGSMGMAGPDLEEVCGGIGFMSVEAVSHISSTAHGHGGYALIACGARSPTEERGRGEEEEGSCYCHF